MEFVQSSEEPHTVYRTIPIEWDDIYRHARPDECQISEPIARYLINKGYRCRCSKTTIYHTIDVRRNIDLHIEVIEDQLIIYIKTWRVGGSVHDLVAIIELADPTALDQLECVIRQQTVINGQLKPVATGHLCVADKP